MLAEELSGPVRTAIEKGSGFILNKSMSIFEKLYTKVKISPPSYNMMSSTMIDILVNELEQRNFDEIGEENKYSFLVRLYSNCSEKLSLAYENVKKTKDRSEKAILENLVNGVDVSLKLEERKRALENYFNDLPQSDHYTANLEYAKILCEAKEINKAVFFANRAFSAIPYETGALNLLHKLDPNNILSEIKEILTE